MTARRIGLEPVRRQADLPRPRESSTAKKRRPSRGRFRRAIANHDGCGAAAGARAAAIPASRQQVSVPPVLEHGGLCQEVTARCAFMKRWREVFSLDPISRALEVSRSGCYDRAGSKTEMIHHRNFLTRAEAESAIHGYIGVSRNRQRRHSRLGFQPPVVFATGSVR